MARSTFWYILKGKRRNAPAISAIPKDLKEDRRQLKCMVVIALACMATIEIG